MIYSKEQQSATQPIEFNNIEGVSYEVVNGLAGSGKTSIAYDALSRAAEAGIESFYYSKSSRLISAASNADYKNTICQSYDEMVSTKLEGNYAAANYKQVGIEDFVRWFRKSKAAEIARLRSEVNKVYGEVPKEDLYIEIQKASLDIGKKGSKYPSIHEAQGSNQGKDKSSGAAAASASSNREDKFIAKKIFESYISNLKTKKLIDYSFASELIDMGAIGNEALEEAEALRAQGGAAAVGEVEEAIGAVGEDDIKFVVIDEAQNFSPLEIKSIVKVAGKNEPFKNGAFDWI